MKRKYVVLLTILGICAAGILAAALSGVLLASDAAFAFGALAVFGALWFGYVSLRVRDDS